MTDYITLANGDIHRRCKGKLHSNDDLPAVELANGDKHWYRYGVLHRDDDLPAIETAWGRKTWYQDGVLHRDNGPADIRENGVMIWYKHGVLTCIEAPLVGKFQVAL